MARETKRDVEQVLPSGHEGARWQSENRCRPDNSILRGSGSWARRLSSIFVGDMATYWLAGAKSDSINSAALSHDRYSLVWQQHRAFKQRDLDDWIRSPSRFYAILNGRRYLGVVTRYDSHSIAISILWNEKLCHFAASEYKNENLNVSWHPWRKILEFPLREQKFFENIT